jgi:hypothetical protein
MPLRSSIRCRHPTVSDRAELAAHGKTSDEPDSRGGYGGIHVTCLRQTRLVYGAPRPWSHRARRPVDRLPPVTGAAWQVAVEPPTAPGRASQRPERGSERRAEAVAQHRLDGRPQEGPTARRRSPRQAREWSVPSARARTHPHRVAAGLDAPAPPGVPFSRARRRNDVVVIDDTTGDNGMTT